MIWSKIWPWLFSRGKKTPLRRLPTSARLAVEALEDRLVPSSASSNESLYQIWSQQIVHVDDTTVTSQVSNASFGSMIGLPSAFASTPYRGQGYSVAVIDTGIDYNNPYLGGGFGPGHRVIAGWNFVNNTANPMDDNGHGTFVAGIIGSSNPTYSGVAPDCNLIALKVLDASGSGTFGAVQSALDWVVANRAKYNIATVNLSLGAGNYTVNPYTFLDTDFNALKNSGVFISVAAGNSYYSNNSAVGLDFPAVDPLVVSVGAVYDGNFGSVAWASGARDYTTAPDRIASFSQRGPALSLLAPGAMVTGIDLNNTIQTMAGTSMASPVVAGAAILIHQEMDALHLTANQGTILSLMKKTGVNVVDGDNENDNVINTGLTFKRIDVGAALASLSQPANAAPVLQAINNQQVAPGGSLTITLSAVDPNGDKVTYSAILLNSSSSQAYQLQQQLGLKYAGAYYTNIWGQNEKWMTSTSGAWYCILPNGEVRRWAGSMGTTLQPNNLIATLDTRFYADPSLLWNAKPSTTALPTLKLVGNQLTVQAPAGVTGSFQIQVSASDGKLSATQTFTLTAQQNTAPQIASVANQSMLTNRSQTITLRASDAQNDTITYSAKIVGTFSTKPASLVINGNQLTVYSSPDYVGSFDVQVTASDGALSSSTTLHVNVAASAVAFRVNGDFNGDGIQDTATLNQDGSWWVSLKKADGTFVNQNWGAWSAASNWDHFEVGDFNGDGKADVLGFSKGGAVWIGSSSGAGFVTRLWTQLTPASNWSLFQVGDFNGDGVTDFVAFNKNGSVWVGTSTGSGFTTNLWTQWSAASSWTSISIADVNGDGKPDLVGKNANGNWYVAYSTGAGFTTKLWDAATPPAGKNPA
jgi:subtilisin family serine protease